MKAAVIMQLLYCYNSALVGDLTIWQPGFNLLDAIWHSWITSGPTKATAHPVERSGGLAATDMCPCGKCQTISDIVNSCPQSKLGGGAAMIALRWWRSYQIAEDVCS